MKIIVRLITFCFYGWGAWDGNKRFLNDPRAKHGGNVKSYAFGTQYGVKLMGKLIILLFQ